MVRGDGGFNGTKESDQLSGGGRSPEEAATPGYGKGKVLYLLIFMALTAVPIFQSALVKSGPFPRHSFARQFFRTFSVLLQTYPY